MFNICPSIGGIFRFIHFIMPLIVIFAFFIIIGIADRFTKSMEKISASLEKIANNLENK